MIAKVFDDCSVGRYVSGAMPAPSIAIFLRTYTRDAQWLPFSLASLRKHARGFKRLVVATPPDDLDVVRAAVTDVGVPMDVVSCGPDPCGGYIAQQITKLEADRWVDEDYTLYWDSDLLLTRGVEPWTFVTEAGKPWWLYEAYSRLSGNVLAWKEATQHATGEGVVVNEYMRRHPFCVPTRMLLWARQHLERVHHQGWREFVAGLSAFSEYNYLGAYFHLHHPAAFQWVDVGQTPDQGPPPCARQFWSWGGLTPEVRAEMDAILAK